MKTLSKGFFAAALVLSTPLPLATGAWLYDEVTTPTEEKMENGGVDMTLPAGLLFGLTALPYGVIGFGAYRVFSKKPEAPKLDTQNDQPQAPKAS